MTADLVPIAFTLFNLALVAVVWVRSLQISRQLTRAERFMRSIERPDHTEAPTLATDAWQEIPVSLDFDSYMVSDLPQQAPEPYGGGYIAPTLEWAEWGAAQEDAMQVEGLHIAHYNPGPIEAPSTEAPIAPIANIANAAEVARVHIGPPDGALEALMPTALTPYGDDEELTMGEALAEIRRRRLSP